MNLKKNLLGEGVFKKLQGDNATIRLLRYSESILKQMQKYNNEEGIRYWKLICDNVSAGNVDAVWEYFVEHKDEIQGNWIKDFIKEFELLGYDPQELR